MNGAPALQILGVPALPELNDKERWQVPCEQAVKEQDAAKLFALIQEINRFHGH